MIPKIIHYCWFGGNPKPKHVLEYIEFWRKHNPSYTIKEWNEQNFDIKVNSYTYEAYLLGKYAFVSDVARLFALKEEGGIYLDTDVRVLKSFDELLNHKSFLGLESSTLVSTACIGAEKGCDWITDFLNIYNKIHFVDFKGIIDVTPNTMRLTRYLKNQSLFDSSQIKLYSIDVLSAKLFPSMEYVTSEKTICIHEFAGSWTKSINYSYWDRIKYVYVRLKALILTKYAFCK